MTIRSKVPNEQYKENFDRIFRQKTTDSVSVVPSPDDDGSDYLHKLYEEDRGTR